MFNETLISLSLVQHRSRTKVRILLAVSQCHQGVNQVPAFVADPFPRSVRVPEYVTEKFGRSSRHQSRNAYQLRKEEVN